MTQRFLTLVFLLLGALPAAAQYPTKPVRLIVSFPPGGIADITARLISPRLAAALGQPVVVENRTGSGGNIGTEFVAKAPPDGHTLLIAPPPVAINVSLYKALPFDTRKDLAPVAILGGTTNVLVVGPKTAARTVQELIEQAKRNPGKLNFASNGNGTTIHLSGELLKLYAGFDARHIPYRGAPAAMAALLAGDVDFMFDALPPSAPHIKGGRVRLLAVTSRERQPMFPEAPTLVESGFPEFEVNSWTGLMTTGGTPQPVIARLESDLRRILADPEAVAAFERTGMAVKFGSAGEFAALLDAEIRRWALAVKHSGAQAD
jgi:tripartite-type tricarboxylate transporter receptor subunit TctC